MVEKKKQKTSKFTIGKYCKHLDKWFVKPIQEVKDIPCAKCKYKCAKSKDTNEEEQSNVKTK